MLGVLYNETQAGLKVHLSLCSRAVSWLQSRPSSEKIPRSIPRNQVESRQSFWMLWLLRTVVDEPKLKKRTVQTTLGQVRYVAKTVSLGYCHFGFRPEG